LIDNIIEIIVLKLLGSRCSQPVRMVIRLSKRRGLVLKGAVLILGAAWGRTEACKCSVHREGLSPRSARPVTPAFLPPWWPG
jgi:hypothetical protein